MRFYNSFSRRKEEFQPLEPGRVKMYVCGITAYDRCHIGHARSAVVFDAVVRYLRYRGYDVTFVRNFTDIDDKIINRANQEGISCAELAQREIEHFYQDMDALGILRADHEPRATEHIQEIIDLIQKLLEKGHAYVAGNDVYFSVRSLPSYGRLSGRNLEELEAGARIAVGEQKRDPLDFALWKGAKPGEPTWNSPWGPGRPGWHIECSAMSMKYLGETLDIHGGGLDLIFPHHENERAQSEAATGQTFVRYWLHNGFVTIENEKMSKSLGNFVTISEILSRHHPEVLRLFLLSKHYRSPLDYSEEAINEQRAALDRIYSALQGAMDAVERPVKKQRPLDDESKALIAELQGLEEAFQEAMDDDFNTAKALGKLFDGVRAINSLVAKQQKRPSLLMKEPLREGAETVKRLFGVLGLATEEPGEYLAQRRRQVLELIGMTEAEVESAIEKRAQARRAKDWAEADRIRDQLEAKGITLMDGPDGTTWGVKL